MTTQPDIQSIVADYPDPVRRLLSIGIRSIDKDEPDYASRYGLGSTDVATLIRLACDKRVDQFSPDNPIVWASTHAAYALAQMQALEAVRPLIDLTMHQEKPDWEAFPNSEEFVEFMTLMGPGALPEIAAYVAEPSRLPSHAAVIPDALGALAVKHPESRDDVLTILTGMLRHYASTDPAVNGAVVAGLLDCNAVETLALIREGFAAQAIDLAFVGDIEDVEIRFGLRKQRTTPRPFNWHWRYDPERLANRVASAEAAPDVGSRSQIPPPLAVAARTPEGKKLGRNDPCPCGSGKKYKKCCLAA